MIFFLNFLSFRFQKLKDLLTIPELISLHQAYYIKKTEYLVKWLLEYRLNQLLQLLTSDQTDENQHEIHLNIKQLRDELQRIHPTNQTREDLSHLRPNLQSNLVISESDTTRTGLKSERPLIRVCDLIQTEIVGVEVRAR